MKLLANLLTLALTETTRTEYEVVAWDLNQNRWVLMTRIPINHSGLGGKPVWDLFQVTIAEIEHSPGERRSNVCRIIAGTIPKPSNYLKGDQRLSILLQLSKNQIVTSPQGTDNYVTIVRTEEVSDIITSEKDSCEDNNQPFFWENRIEFKQNGQYWTPASGRIGVACKDLRWKTYWHEIAKNHPEHIFEARDKWRRILNDNSTFFVIEFYNAHQNYVIAGVHSL